MTQDRRHLRINRALLLYGGLGYLGWWLFVRLALPNAFNPLGSRLLVVAFFWAGFGLSYLAPAVVRRLHGWLTVACGLATVHYFWLFDRNGADLTWTIGSYITVVVVCAILQTARSLATYSVFVALVCAGFAAWHPQMSNIVFVPGMLTMLLFANLGLRGRLRLLAQLQEERQRIASLFDAGFEGIAVHDAGIIREANGGLARLLGYNRAELIGMSIGRLLRGEMRSEGQFVMPPDEPREDVAIRKDGGHVPVEVDHRPHMLDGKPMRLVAVRDLTARRQAEEALLHANRELESFSYSVAHDLRAPLRSIGGFSRILREDYATSLDAEGKRHAERIAAGAETMGQLIDALLGLARTARSEPRREPVDLSRVAQAVAHQLRSLHPERQVEFETPEGVTARGDPQLLHDLLANLIGNAWKFTARRPEARVSFGVTERDGVPIYFVRDNGAGFDMDRSKRLFVPFQRLHDPSEYPGTGIGLATVQRIVHRHGGRIWADGAVHRGATFYFTLQSGLPEPVASSASDGAGDSGKDSSTARA